MPQVLAGLALASGAGCGARYVAVEPGSLTCSQGPCEKGDLAGLTMTVSADRTQVTFTPKSGPPVTRAAKGWPKDKWPNLCPAGMRAILPEVLELGPAPLVLGAVEVKNPVVVADCRGGTGLDVKSLRGEDVGGPEALRFSR